MSLARNCAEGIEARSLIVFCSMSVFQSLDLQRAWRYVKLSLTGMFFSRVIFLSVFVSNLYSSLWRVIFILFS